MGNPNGAPPGGLPPLRGNTLSASDLSRIQNALTFLSPLCRDTREAHKDMMGVTLKPMLC